MMQAALVVGCGEFTEINIPSLKYAAQDARRFATCLSANCGVHLNDIALLADSKLERLIPLRPGAQTVVVGGGELVLEHITNIMVSDGSR
jgi:hypothetical protein